LQDSVALLSAASLSLVSKAMEEFSAEDLAGKCGRG